VCAVVVNVYDTVLYATVHGSTNLAGKGSVLYFE